MRLLSVSNMNIISNDTSPDVIKDLLSDDSDYSEVPDILRLFDFRPQSFTIGDRQDSLIHLDKSESDFDDWCNSMIRSQLKKICEIKEIVLSDSPETLKIIRSNVDHLLNFAINGLKVRDNLWNQEFVDILDNIIKFSLFGNPGIDVDTNREYNEVARRILPGLIRKKRMLDLDILTIFKISIASGLSALDLKGSHAASSLLRNTGIPMEKYLKKSIDETIEYYYSQLRIKADSPTPIFHWEKFLEIIQEKDVNLNIVWFTDDNFETHFDLLFLQKLLNEFENVKIKLIPKNGTFGTDTSWSDILDYFLTLDIYQRLNDYKEMGRISICKKGPRMGAANIFKLSKEVVSIIKSSDLVVIKGCRMYEMLQGGLNVPSFVAYVVVREMSERITGLDSENSPLIFSYLSPGEFAFFGLKSKNLRTKEVYKERRIPVCESTVEEHYKRMSTVEPQEIIDEIKSLLSRKENLYDDFTPLFEEANALSEKLVEFTRETYNNLCQICANSWWEEPHELDKKMWNFLFKFVNEKIESKQLGGNNKTLTLLDAGTGSGRDIMYATQKLGIKVIGIDNAEGFIACLKKIESEGKIPEGSYILADMRDLSFFPDNTIDIVRQNASLLHLPIISKGYMADLAIRESYRILKNHGLIFIFVKEGDGLQFMDTAEGVGGRVFQFFREESIKELVTRNGFSILFMSHEIEYRGDKKIPWIAIIAEKIERQGKKNDSLAVAKKMQYNSTIGKK